MRSWKTEPEADLDEAFELGPCSGRGALVPADAVSIRAAADRFSQVAAGAATVTDLLRRVEAGEWVGESGGAFREVVGELPAPYEQAAGAFGDVARVLADLASAVERGRGAADRAIARWQEAEWESQRWRADRELWEDLDGDLGTSHARTGRVFPADDDPGEPIRRDARRIMDEAQHEIEVADERAHRTILGATRQAPRDRGWLSAARGVRDGVTAPFTMTYGLTLSGQRGENWSALGESVTHPVDTAQATWQAFVEDPDRFVGALGPGVLLGGSRFIGPVREAPAAMRPRLPEATDPWTHLNPMAHDGSSVPVITSELPPVPARRWPSLDSGPQLMRGAQWVSSQSAKIAAHAWEKHGLERHEFPWVNGEAGLADYVATVMRNPTEAFTGLPGRGIYWDGVHKVMVIQQDDHTGTVYPCRKSQFDRQVANAMRDLVRLHARGGTS